MRDPRRPKVHSNFGWSGNNRTRAPSYNRGEEFTRMRLISLGLALTLAGIGLADTVTLRNGSVVKGTYLGGTARQVRIDNGDQIRTIDVDDISKIEFTAPAPTAAAPPPPAPAPTSAPA